MSENKKPLVGLGVIIKNQDGNVLLVKRKGKHAPYYSIPGGKLEPGETFEAGAIREIEEETGIRLINPQVIALTNNLETYRQEDFHSISIILFSDTYEGEPKIMEPDKFEEMIWADPTNLPMPHFDASRMGVQCYLENKFYIRFE